MANRSNKRELERQKQKNEKWISSLNSNQIAIVRGAIKEGVANDLERYLQVSTLVFSSILLSDAKLDIAESERLLEIFDKEFVDMAKWVDQNKDGWMNYLKDIDNKAKDRIKKLIKEGKGQKEIVAAIKKEFNVANAAAKRSYEVVREEMDLQEATEYIFNEPVVDIEPVKEVSNNKLKVLSQKVTMELEGEFEKYRVEKNNDETLVTVLGDVEYSFDSLEAIEEYKEKEIDIFLRKINEIKEVIKS